MVERSLRMREARGSIPRISNFLLDTRCVNLKLESSSPVITHCNKISGNFHRFRVLLVPFQVKFVVFFFNLFAYPVFISPGSKKKQVF